MNRPTAETVLLDEKIARIRKQNEEIIKRKQIIDEEIKNAEQNNAIVNIKKAYSDKDNDEPSLYSDSVTTHAQKTISYPKIQAKQNQRAGKRKDDQKDVAWRREREQIDNERIRRQKAASGWKREWDANKTLENENDQRFGKSERDTNRSQGRRSNGNNEDGWNYKRDGSFRSQGRRPSESEDDGWNMKRDTSYRSQLKKPTQNDDDNWEGRRDSGYRSQERKFNDNNRKSQVRFPVWDVSEMRKLPQNEHEIKKPFTAKVEEIENESAARKQTFGPLNQNKEIDVKEENVPNVITNKVTQYSKVKVQTPTCSVRRTNDFSNREDRKPEGGLADRLKKIVIHVKNEDNKEQRIVEIVGEPAKNAPQKIIFDSSSLKNVKFDNMSAKKPLSDNNLTKNLFSPTLVETLTFTNSASRSSSVFSFGNENISSEVGASSHKTVMPLVADTDNSHVSSEVKKTSDKVEAAPLIGILKTSPQVASKEKSTKDIIKMKKTVVIKEKKKAENTEVETEIVEDDGNDEEWEDVSDDEEGDVFD